MPTKLKAPAHLSDEAKKMFRTITTDYRIDAAASMVLVAGLEALDRRNEARKVIATEGAIIKDRFGFPKAHPACIVERDASSTLFRAFRLLGLDLESVAGGR